MNLQKDTEANITILHPSEVIFTLRPEAVSESDLSFITFWLFKMDVKYKLDIKFWLIYLLLNYQ